jgi:hypothetical protein
MESKKYNIVGTIQKSKKNRKIVETEAKSY